MAMDDSMIIPPQAAKRREALRGAIDRVRHVRDHYGSVLVCKIQYGEESTVSSIQPLLELLHDNPVG